MVAAQLLTAARIDPLAPSPAGLWHGNGVTVRRIPPARLPGRRLHAHREGDRLVIEHRLTPAELSDELATTIVADLADDELLYGQADFEEAFTGLVRSTVDGPEASWQRFYANSVARLESGAAGFAPIHAYAADLIKGRDVIDLGSCFGFFPLRLAKRGLGVVATDLSGPTMTLLSRMVPLLRRRVLTLVCDASAVPLPDGCAGTVTALHLLEHLSPQQADFVLDEAVRLARRRVVVAVPFEEEPTACYGHLQRFGPADLDQLAGRLSNRHPGLRVRTAEHHGGWLIADR